MLGLDDKLKINFSLKVHFIYSAPHHYSFCGKCLLLIVQMKLMISLINLLFDTASRCVCLHTHKSSLDYELKRAVVHLFFLSTSGQPVSQRVAVIRQDRAAFFSHASAVVVGWQPPQPKSAPHYSFPLDALVEKRGKGKGEREMVCCQFLQATHLRGNNSMKDCVLDRTL